MSEGPRAFRSRRSALNFGASALATAVSLVASLVAAPYLLAWLGHERYGAYRAASDWVGYLGLVELGLGGAIAPLLLGALARRDDETVARTLAEGIRAYTPLVFLGLLAGAALALASPHLLHPSATLAPDLLRGMLVGAAALLLLPLQPFVALAHARQRSSAVSILLALQSVVAIGLALVLAHGGLGVTGQFIALLAGQVVFLTTLLAMTRSLVPGVIRLLRSRSHFDAERRAIWRLSWPTLLENVSGRVSLLTDNIIIALLLGPVAVVPFFFTQRVAQLLQSQLQNVGTATWAALSDLETAGERDRFNRRLVELTGLVAAAGAATLVSVVVFNRAFVSLWVGAPQYAGPAVNALAAANAYVLGVLSLWGFPFFGTGRVALTARVHARSAAVNIAASLALTALLGLPGPLLGTSVALAATTGWNIPLLLKRTFDTSLAALVRASLRPLLVAVPVGVAAWALQLRYAPSSWASLAAAVTATSGAVALLWWAALLSREERAGYRERLRAVLRRPLAATP